MTEPDGYFALTHSAGFRVDHAAGQFEATGTDATAYLNRVVTADLSLLSPGHSAPTLLLRDDGSILARLIVHRFPDKILLVTSGASRATVWEELVGRKRGQVRLRDISDETSLLQVRGPTAAALLRPSLIPQPKEPGSVITSRCGAIDVFAARTLNDGPDGFDLHSRRRDLEALCLALVSAGIKPVSESAWGIFRVEWGVADVGIEIDVEDTPLEAALEDLVKEGKGAPFPGEFAVAARRRSGPIKRLVGVKITGDGQPPRGAGVRLSGLDVERLRSVEHSPRVGIIGVIAVPTSAMAVGTSVTITSGETSWHGEVARRPFVTRGGV